MSGVDVDALLGAVYKPPTENGEDKKETVFHEYELHAVLKTNKKIGQISL